MAVIPKNLSEGLHTSLLAAGMVPGPSGVVADLIDSALYASEGRVKDSLWSLLAAVPIVGVGAGLAKAKKLSKVGRELIDKRKFYNKMIDQIEATGYDMTKPYPSFIAMMQRYDKGGMSAVQDLVQSMTKVTPPVFQTHKIAEAGGKVAQRTKAAQGVNVRPEQARIINESYTPSVAQKNYDASRQARNDYRLTRSDQKAAVEKERKALERNK
jgi:hypothetical protein